MRTTKDFMARLRRRAEADLRVHHTVGQMKLTSGTYSEIELIRSDSAQDEENRAAKPAVKITSSEWDEEVQKLAVMFGGAKKGSARPQPTRRGGVPITQIKTGALSSLQEDEWRYYATAIVKKSKDRLKLATVEWRKEPLGSWRARAEDQMPKGMAMASANYTFPTISDEANGCADNTWAATRYVPSGRNGHTAVWTGNEMIIWGGVSEFFNVLNTGGRYNPSTDSWTATSTTSAPTGRFQHTAIWTGSEMIVWGGFDTFNFFNTGGRYNPSTDSWAATSTTNAPSSRRSHTAVWTGSEMIIWGGTDFAGSYLNTGGRYNPSTDSWTATSTINGPSGRNGHTAVWTGGEMIVWGGDDASGYLNTGGKYNPSTDSWTTTSATNAPTARDSHTAAWTGGEMILWGGICRLRHLFEHRWEIQSQRRHMGNHQHH
jgi:hypothetical protein